MGLQKRSLKATKALYIELDRFRRESRGSGMRWLREADRAETSAIPILTTITGAVIRSELPSKDRGPRGILPTDGGAGGGRVWGLCGGGRARGRKWGGAGLPGRRQEAPCPPRRAPRSSRRSARSATSQNRGEDTNRYESVFSSSSFLREALECLRGKGNKDVRAVSVDRAIRSGRPGRAFFAIGFVFDSIDFGCSPCKVKRYRVSLVVAEREARDLYNDENSHTFYSVYY